MAYANVQKNGSLNDRIGLQALDAGITTPDKKGNHNEKSADTLLAAAEYEPQHFTTPISIDIRDDVNDQAVHGRKRRRNEHGYGR